MAQRIEEIVGANILRLRQQASPPMSQTTLGERLGDYLGTPWPRQGVSMAERGRRSFTVAELCALSLVLEVSLLDLVLPQRLATAEPVDLGSGDSVSVGDFAAAVTGGGHMTLDAWSAAELISGTTKQMRTMADRAHKATADATAAAERVTALTEKLRAEVRQLERRRSDAGAWLRKRVEGDVGED